MILLTQYNGCYSPIIAHHPNPMMHHVIHGMSGILTFCQFFFNKDTRKLTLSCTFWKICFSSILTLPTATPMHSTFLSWNLTIALVSLTLASRDSWWETSVGNFPVKGTNKISKSV